MTAEQCGNSGPSSLLLGSFSARLYEGLYADEAAATTVLGKGVL